MVYIRSEANLADASSCQRGLDMWSLQQPTQQELLYLVEVTLGTQVCRTRLPADRTQSLQDSQRLFTVVSAQLSTACSSTRDCPARYLLGNQTLQQEASRHFARASTRGGQPSKLHAAYNFANGSRLRSSCETVTRRPKTVHGQVLRSKMAQV